MPCQSSERYKGPRLIGRNLAPTADIVGPDLHQKDPAVKEDAKTGLEWRPQPHLDFGKVIESCPYVSNKQVCSVWSHLALLHTAYSVRRRQIK